jgi:hypothetical protein
MQENGCAAHVVWNPLSGEIVQTTPATRAALTHGCGTTREGRICVQIVVIGLLDEPFTNGPLHGLETILAWLDSWHVARNWPAGPPLPPPQARQSTRSHRVWARGGHFGASQMPDIHGIGPGGIDITKITGGPNARVAIPRPRSGSPEPLLRPAAGQANASASNHV